jgi:uncharacterized protein (TIGR03083 family)
MTATPGYAELVAAVRREGEAMLAAAKQGDVPVPTVGEWTMSDLLRHVAEVYTWVAHIVTERVTERPPREPVSKDADPVLLVADALDELVSAFGTTDATTPVWNWSPQPDVAAVWARRMAHESAIHRNDAQRAHGVAQPIDAELAHDGMDELLDVIVPRVIERDELELPAMTISFVATDEGSWHVRLEGSAITRLEVAKEPDVTARGTASALLLGAYGRVPWDILDVEGDASRLETWSSTIHF